MSATFILQGDGRFFDISGTNFKTPGALFSPPHQPAAESSSLGGRSLPLPFFCQWHISGSLSTHSSIHPSLYHLSSSIIHPHTLPFILVPLLPFLPPPIHLSTHLPIHQPHTGVHVNAQPLTHLSVIDIKCHCQARSRAIQDTGRNE